MNNDALCPVCLAPPPEGKYHQFHYGGPCCFSCKAFFRRCHRDDGIANKLYCKNNNRCDFEVLKKNKCKKCRHQRCLQNGMKPHRVLQGEDREKFNFAKYRKQRIPIPAAEHNAEPDLNFLLDSISSCFILATAEVKISPQVVEVVIQGHLKEGDRGKEYDLAIQEVFQNIKALVLKFAEKSALMQSLSVEDQEALLAKNGDLYVKYIAARYFAAKNGSDQLGWLLGANMPLMDAEQLFQCPAIEYVTFHQVRKITSMNDPQKFKSLMKSIKDISEKFDFPCFFNSLLLHCILFYNFGRIHLREQRRVESIYDLSKAVAKQSCQGDFSIGIDCIDQLIQSLDQMNDLATKNELALFNPEGTLMTERQWVDSKILTVQSIFENITLGSIYISQMLDCITGKDLSKVGIVLDQDSKMLHARFQATLDSLTDTPVSRGERVFLAKRNYDLAIALDFAMGETFDTPEGLIRFRVGKKKDLTSFELDKYSRVSFQEILIKINFLSKDQFEVFSKVLSRIKEFLANDEVFFLTHLFIIMGEADNLEIKKIQQIITRGLLQRLSDEVNDPERTLALFLKDLTAFRQFMDRFIQFYYGMQKNMVSHTKS